MHEPSTDNEIRRVGEDQLREIAVVVLASLGFEIVVPIC